VPSATSLRTERSHSRWAIRERASRRSRSRAAVVRRLPHASASRATESRAPLAAARSQDGVVVAGARGREVPLDPLRETAHAVDLHSRWRLGRPGSSHGHVDGLVVVPRTTGTLVRPERGVEAQGRPGPGHQDGGPRTLPPGEWSGVLDVHARMHDRPLAPTQPALDVVRVLTGCQHLPSGDQNVLCGEDGDDVHGDIVRGVGPRFRASGADLWTTEIVSDPSHLVDRIGHDQPGRSGCVSTRSTCSSRRAISHPPEDSA
jgi:hypothetical protein